FFAFVSVFLVKLSKIATGAGGGDGHCGAGIHQGLQKIRVNIYSNLIRNATNYDFIGDHSKLNLLAFFEGDVSFAVCDDFHVFLIYTELAQIVYCDSITKCIHIQILHYTRLIYYWLQKIVTNVNFELSRVVSEIFETRTEKSGNIL